MPAIPPAAALSFFFPSFLFPRFLCRKNNLFHRKPKKKAGLIKPQPAYQLRFPTQNTPKGRKRLPAWNILVRNQEQGAGMRSTPDTLLLYFKDCITYPAKIHFHIVNQANIAYNNRCVSQTCSALCGSLDTNLCPALLRIVQGGTPLSVPDILNHILPQSHLNNKYKIYAGAGLLPESSSSKISRYEARVTLPESSAFSMQPFVKPHFANR